MRGADMSGARDVDGADDDPVDELAHAATAAAAMSSRTVGMRDTMCARCSIDMSFITECGKRELEILRAGRSLAGL